MCVKERDGEWLPWEYEAAQTRICDIAGRWSDVNLHFGFSVGEYNSNCEMAVGNLSLN